MVLFVVVNCAVHTHGAREYIHTLCMQHHAHTRTYMYMVFGDVDLADVQSFSCAGGG